MITGKPRENIQFDRFTALDFAVLALLERVQTSVIDPLIEGWCGHLSTEIRLAHNLASGILAIWEQLPPTLQDQDERRALEAYVWQETRAVPEEILKGSVRKVGRFLFNCYYYVLSREFGSFGLVPVVPGFTSPTTQPECSQLHAFIDRCELPLHLSRDYVDTYSTLVLPAKAGVTPRYLQLFAGGIEASPSHMVGRFLGDLAILQKREDFVHRHFSSHIVPIGDREEPLGAFVLTAAIPEILSVPIDKLTSLTRLTSLIRDVWPVSPLKNLHSELHRTRRGIRTSSQVMFRRRELTSSEAPFNEALHETMAGLAEDGAYAIRAAYYDASVRICSLTAINFEGLGRVFSLEHPVNAWFDSGTALRSSGARGGILAAAEIVDVNRISEACSCLRAIATAHTSARERSQAWRGLMRAPTWCRLLEVLYPKLKENKEDDVVANISASARVTELTGASGQRVGALLVFHGPPDQANVETPGDRLKVVRTLLSSIGDRAALQLDVPLLPGATDEFFASAQQRWRDLQRAGPASAAAQEDGRGQDARSFCDGVADLFQADVSIRGIAVLRDHDTFVPLIDDENSSRAHPNGPMAAFWCAYLAPSSFWLFESICHLLTEPVPTQYFNTRGDMSSPPFRTWDEDAITVRITGIDEIDSVCASALTYLGVPVSSWLRPDDEDPGDHPSWVMTADALEADITRLFRNYLKSCLNRGEKNQAIHRALQASAARPEIDRIEASIRSDGRGVTFIFHFVRDLDPMPVSWSRTACVAPQFHAFSDSLLSENLAVPPLCKSGLAIEVISADGTAIQRSLPSDQEVQSELVDLYDRCERFIFELQQSFRDGELESQRMLGHEFSSYFSMVRPLVEVCAKLRMPEYASATDRAQDGLALMELSFQSLTEFSTRDLLFPDERRAPEIVARLLQLAATEGVYQCSVAGDANLRVPLAAAFRRILSANSRVEIGSYTFPPAAGQDGTEVRRRLRLEKLITALAANAVKHSASYVVSRLGVDSVSKLEKFMAGDEWRDLLTLDIDACRMFAANLGTRSGAESFKERFTNRPYGTHNVMIGCITNRSGDLWSAEGSISVTVEDAGARTSRYTVEATLPNPSFRKVG